MAEIKVIHTKSGPDYPPNMDTFTGIQYHTFLSQGVGLIYRLDGVLVEKKYFYKHTSPLGQALYG